jgi:hypothetical protein
VGGWLPEGPKTSEIFAFRASRQDGFAGCTVRQKSNGGVPISRRSGFFGEVAMVASHSERWREIYCSRDWRHVGASKKRSLVFVPNFSGFFKFVHQSSIVVEWQPLRVPKRGF